MSQPDWNVVQKLYNELLPLPPDKQEQVLREQCEGDQALFEEVWSLLQAGKEASQFLRQSADTLFAQELEPGTTIGAYRLIRPLGRGGSGTVYLAWQRSETVERLVAIKVLRPGLDDAATRERFSLEQQVLADLQHPHIARLYDAGVTAGGRPYAVMEYVDGLPLDTFCAERTLSLQERLSLFIQVCDAVQYAHSKLVLHRDLKPSNIFVTQEEGGPPRVQLLDFGLAKLLDPEHRADLTATQERALTPHYASPEQVRGAPVSTATDVYSLGVVLYELLTGAKPLDLSDASPISWERIIAEENPTLPSKKAASQADDDTQTHAPSALEGDLDNIVLKALRKEPARRYESVRALADDIERHLKGHPVTAREPTWRYRASRFVKRHRSAVVASIVALLLVLGGASAALWQASIAATERDRAQEEAAANQQSLDFITGLFESAAPNPADGEDLTAQVLLERSIDRIDALESQPRAQGRLLRLIGDIYRQLGDRDQAEALLTQAIERKQPLTDDASRLELTSSQMSLAYLFIEQGQYEKAEELYSLALSERQDLLPSTDPMVGAAKNGMATVLSSVGRLTEAASYGNEALAILEAAYDGENASVRNEKAAALLQLGNIYHKLGDYDRAIHYYQRHLPIARLAHGDIDIRVSTSLNNLGSIHSERHEFEEAIALVSEALDIRKTIFGENHYATANIMANLGVMKYQVEDYAGALDLAQQSHVIQRRVHGDVSPWTTTVASLIARIHSRTGEPGRALVLYDSVLIHQKQLYDNIPHASIGQTYGSIANILGEQGEIERAVTYFEKSNEIYLHSLAPTHRRIVSNKIALAGFYRDNGQFIDAEQLLVDLHDDLEEGPEEHRFSQEDVRRHLVRLYETMERPELAAMYRATIED